MFVRSQIQDTQTPAKQNNQATTSKIMYCHKMSHISSAFNRSFKFVFDCTTLFTLMSYAHGMPWPWKVLCLLCLWVHPYDLNMDKHSKDVVQTCVFCVTAVLLACMLPACCYSVINRHKTNRLICQCLMLQCICIACFEAITMLRRESKWLNFKHVYMLLMYQCYCLAKQLKFKTTTLPWQNSVRFVCWSMFIALLLCTLLLTTRQNAYISITGLLSIVFVGELASLSVIVVNRALEGIANEYESFFFSSE